jgi:AraC-like DNA-binding protein
MLYREFPPDARLRPFVRVCWTLSGPGADMAPQPILPDGCTELIVHRARPFWRHHAAAAAERQPAHLFVGQMLAPAVIAPDGDADVVAIRFEPFGAHALIGTPQTETADLIVDAGALGEPWLNRAVRAAEAADSADAAVKILETALIARLERTRHQHAPDARVIAATRALIASAGRLSVDATARRAGTSTRQLERLFQQQIGTSPKRFARVLRFQHAASNIIDGAPAPLADISTASGYFDQAHMIRDFVTFAGTTPGQFAARLGELTRVMLS